MSDAHLVALAEQAGIVPRWRDYRGTMRDVAPAVLREVLAALGFPAGSESQFRDSERRLREEQQGAGLPPLILADEGRPIPLRVPPGRFRVLLEDGMAFEGAADAAAGGAVIPPIAIPGYHLLEIGTAQTTIAVAPPRCFSLADAGAEPGQADNAGRRPWGLAVQLYALRRDGDGGIGDFTALRRFVGSAARHGAAAVAISPVHAQFSADPDRFSPYAPSSRLALSVCHVDLDELGAGLPLEPAAAAERERLEALALIDWPAAARARLSRLRRICRDFASLPVALRREFADFAARRPDMESHARFEALHAQFFGSDPGRWHWRSWPEQYRDPLGPAVDSFAREHADEVRFHFFLQFLAERQLQAAQAAARAAGMKVGLIADLAVGSDSGGSQGWSRQNEMLIGLTIGAPPDLLNLQGQNWGVAAFSPSGLRRNGYGGFIDMLRAALRHAGGLRIDHVMGLGRLWVVPEGAGAMDGAYVRFPLDDMLRLVALESRRHRGIVLGEDLGTVAEGFRARLEERRIMGLRVLWFERDAETFHSPATWTRDTVGMTSTHDVPTVAGWWRGRDLDWRKQLNMIGDDQAVWFEYRESQQRPRPAVARLPRQRCRVRRYATARAPGSRGRRGRSPYRRSRLRPGHAAAGGRAGRAGASQPAWDDDRTSQLAQAYPGCDGSPARRAGGGRASRGARPRASAMIALRATVRLQFHKGFTLDQARELLPYFDKLGISHIYASPLLKSRSGSTHGYDIVDHHAIDPELGGEPALRRLVDELRRNDMGLILDIVPNHMGVGGADNAWWLDVLEWGRASPYAEFFDIDWDPPDISLRGRLLAPFLGKPYGECLDDGELQLRFDEADGRLFVAYYGHRFPIAPRDYASVLLSAGPPLEEAARAFVDIVPSGREAVRRQARQARERLRAPELRQAVDDALRVYDATTPEGRDVLHRLLERQHYRLSWWRAAADEINWRRFFDINSLAGIRVELPDVFDATHGYVLKLYADGLIDGLRIDHVDGLADPRGYCRKLRRRLQTAAEQRPNHLPDEPAVLWVEKILAPHERLAREWLTDGTTGYDFMNQVSAVLHDPSGEASLTHIWTGFTGRPGEFEQEVRAARRQILGSALASETLATAATLHRLARRDPKTRDFTLTSIYRALVEILVHFHVYRIYAGLGGISAVDARELEWAMAGARRTVRYVDLPVLELLGRWLAGEGIRAVPAGTRRHEWLRAMVRFQQLSAPTAAKSVEDTAFYRYGRLLSRNDVGADPGHFAMTPSAFHAANAERRRSHPRALLATATHDHKRGADMRARLAVLSEIPDEWEAALIRWMRLNAPLKREIEGSAAPDAADELMLYQTVIGAWPLDLSPDDRPALDAYAERLQAWQVKALREAKRHSEWSAPNETYEAASREFLTQLLDPDRPARLVYELAEFAGRIAPAGALNGLAQTLLRMTCPGVPDLYQGTEFWDLTLVDPDNRRPIDYHARSVGLDTDPGLPSLVRDWKTGHIKQQLIARTLRLRARSASLFLSGGYLPLRVEGGRADHIFAFLRAHEDRAVIVVAPRLAARLPGVAERPLVDSSVWRGTFLHSPRKFAGRSCKDALGGAGVGAAGRLQLEKILATFPVALLEVQ